MDTSKLKFTVIFTVIILLVNYEPLAAFNVNGQGETSDFYGRMHTYLARQSFSVESSDDRALARLGRTRFVNRSFGRKINKRPNFNQRLQKKLNRRFRDIRAHKNRGASGRRIKSNRLVKRKSLLTDGRRAFQDTLRHRLQNRPQSRFRERLHDRFQRQNNGPRLRRLGSRHHR